MKCRPRSRMMVSSFVRQASCYLIILDIGALAVALLLTVCSKGSGNPAWSPSGSKIAFKTDSDGYAEIYIMDVDESNPTRLTNTADMAYSLTLSPDGTKIVRV